MVKSKVSQIHRLYVANFLIGLVFWYGIEKLFMKSIGLDATAVGFMTAYMLLLNMVFDIPAGMLADRWSRKGMLIVAACALGAASLLLGISHDFWTYLIGYTLYSVYVVSSNGTFQALVYDTLKEQGSSATYIKYIGRSFGFFLAGAAVGNATGGLIASTTNLAVPFFVSVIPCLLNVLVILSLHEPTIHRSAPTQPAVTRIRQSLKAIAHLPLVRTLAIILCTFWIIEVFKSDFGQLYFLHYVTAPDIFGYLWAAYAVVWAIGGVIAHHFENKFTLSIAFATIPIISMACLDHWSSIGLFMVQGLAMGVLQNQIESKVQHATPSHVRASILSVLSSIGRGIGIPASLLFGWTFAHQGVMPAVAIVGVVATLILLYWLAFFFLQKQPSEAVQSK